jgi:hypothetical protein
MTIRSGEGGALVACAVARPLGRKLGRVGKLRERSESLSLRSGLFRSDGRLM